MTELKKRLSQLRRPSLLIQAARIGANNYNRAVQLRRFLGVSPPNHFETSLRKLIEIEEILNENRKRQSAGYSCVEHVDLLITIMGEARLLQASSPS